MKKFLLIVLAVVAVAAGSIAVAETRAISGGLPWNNNAAEPVLDAKLAEMFPDGTPVEVLNTALAKERFAMVSDDRGYSTPTGDGSRYASRGVVRLVFGCSTRVALRWEQRDGQVFDMEGNMHQGCL